MIRAFLICRALGFLVSEVQANAARSIDVLHSEWRTVEIRWGNLVFTVVRWQGDTNISVAPRHAPRESYELGPLVAALECRHFSESDVINDLADAGNLLRPRLQALQTDIPVRAFVCTHAPSVLPSHCFKIKIPRSSPR